MAYIISSTEKLKKPGSEMETKALLYLMNFRNDSDEIHYFIVDFFNDLTGMNNSSSKLWDIQSKGAKNNSPKSIGKELVTLYKNYVSTFEFDYLILFLGGVSNSVLEDNTKKIFTYKDIKNNSLIKLKEGLKEECDAKTYIESTKISNAKIDEFIEKVVFVIDDKQPAEYVKKIIETKIKIIPENEVLEGVFNEIRDKQSILKNSAVLDGITIQTTDESLNYYRHLTNSEIRLLVLQRVLNRNPMEDGIPFSFLDILQICPHERKKDMLEDCKQTLCRALFNKNNADSFWRLFSEICDTISNNPNLDTQRIFALLNKKIIENCYDFDALATKYFIAIIKDGLNVN